MMVNATKNAAMATNAFLISLINWWMTQNSDKLKINKTRMLSDEIS